MRDSIGARGAGKLCLRLSFPMGFLVKVGTHLWNPLGVLLEMPTTAVPETSQCLFKPGFIISA